MSRALVLGGGGPVGIGWEAGLIVGLTAHGVELAGADSVVGTSAGSVVGFALASGADLAETAALVGSADPGAAAPGPGAPPAPSGALETMMSLVAEASVAPEGAEAVRARLGAIAAGSATMGDEEWLGMFAFFAGQGWPSSYRCTAVDTATGAFRVWDGSAGVPAQLAVASSCAVPGIFPPVEIDGARWMDGGVRDMLNADVAAGHDVVVAVSCTLLDLPEGFAAPEMEAIFAGTKAQLEGLRRAGSAVEVVVPGAEMLEVSGWGLSLMDASRVQAAYDAGVRQADAEAERLRAAWGLTDRLRARSRAPAGVRG